MNINYPFKILFYYSQPSLLSNFIIYNNHKLDSVKAESIIKKLIIFYLLIFPLVVGFPIYYYYYYNYRRLIDPPVTHGIIFV